MEVLYHRSRACFIIKENRDFYFVFLSKEEAYKIDEISVQSILRGGYWEVAEGLELTAELMEKLSTLIHSARDMES